MPHPVILRQMDVQEVWNHVRETKFYKVKNANKLTIEAYTTWMTGNYTNHFTN